MLGWSFLEAPHFEGPKWENPPKNFKIFGQIFFLIIIRKVKHIIAAFKHLFQSIQQFAKLWDLRPPPVDKGLKVSNLSMGHPVRALSCFFLV